MSTESRYPDEAGAAFTPSGLTPEDYGREYMRRSHPSDDPLNCRTHEQLEALVKDWTRDARPRSEHMEASIIFADYKHYRNGDPMPLRDGERVPGCTCRECTPDLPADHPARHAAQRGFPRPEALPARDVDAARAVSLLEVVATLGLGEPRRAGREYVVTCPLHPDSRPSLRLNLGKGAWFCHPCGEGGDGLALVMRVRACTFADAVRVLVR